jgi:hypothetical protein
VGTPSDKAHCPDGIEHPDEGGKTPPLLPLNPSFTEPQTPINGVLYYGWGVGGGTRILMHAALQAGAMPESVIADIAAQILEGLVYLHKYRHTVSKIILGFPPLECACAFCGRSLRFQSAGCKNLQQRRPTCDRLKTNTWFKLAGVFLGNN